MAADLRTDGVSIKLITAQPGGTEFLQQALIDRGCERLPDIVTLVSDPDHTLLVKDAGDIFIVQQQDQYMSQSYQMVQPALVVIDTATGATIPALTWSWKTMKDLLPGDIDFGSPDAECTEVVPGVELVAYRPMLSDLRAALGERRPVKLGSVAMSMAEIEEQCQRYGDV